MAIQVVNTSSIFLTLVCAVIIAISVGLNLSLFLTLMKLRRIRRTDKSNYFLIHLIFVDLVCTCLICIPSGYGIYAGGELDKAWCHIQTYFTTFAFTITFHGFVLLAIERYIKFKEPEFHIDTFSTENKPSTAIACLKTSAFIVPVWIVDCVISFIPLFANFNDQQYFTIQSQCDYQYEKFKWWLWLYFFVCLTIPFAIALVFFILTILLIHGYGKEIKNNVRQDHVLKEVSQSERARNKYFNQVREAKRFDIYTVQKQVAKKTKAATVSPDGVDNAAKYDENSAQSILKKRKVFAQFKYRTEISKTICFFIIICLSYVCIFPLCVIHFYRAYNTKDSNYDNNDLIDWKVYTSFAWLSYFILIIKPAVCYAGGKFYRDAFYQAANIRGFRGKFHYEYDIRGKKKNVQELKNEQEQADEQVAERE